MLLISAKYFLDLTCKKLYLATGCGQTWRNREKYKSMYFGQLVTNTHELQFITEGKVETKNEMDNKQWNP